MLSSIQEQMKIVFGSSEWLPVAIAVFVLVTILTIVHYARSERAWWRFGAAASKIFATGLLAFFLLQPMREVERPRPGANAMAVLADNSRSMLIGATGDEAARASRLRTTLGVDAEWMERIGQDFDLRRYTFDSRLQTVAAFEQMQFDGKHSELGTVLVELQKRFENRPLAGLLLFTDGLSTDDMTAFLENIDDAFPIYPVVQSSDSTYRDASLHDTSVQLSSFELAPVTLETTVSARGFNGNDLIVRVLDRSEQELARETVSCGSDELEQRVRMRFQLKEPGTQFVKVQVNLAAEVGLDLDTTNSITSEITFANNHQTMVVDRSGGPFKILYIGGRPNWEFKFLRRALEADVELSLSALLRIAKKEPKFSFRDRGIDGSNALLSGFEDGDDSKEQYDEPVIVSLGVEEDSSVRSGFPADAEALFDYHAIILDDIEASFFTQQQMLLLRRFVAERGGGLMMLGGQESFANSDYQDTPLAEMLPVYLRSRDADMDKSQPIRFQLTREGLLEPWIRLRDTEADETVRSNRMPEFTVWNATSAPKPGSVVLAEMRTEDNALPGLVAQRFGNGRTLALTVGDFWRWSMRRNEGEADDLSQIWRQIGHWITNDTPKRVATEVIAPLNSIGPHRIIVRPKDAEYRPLDNASVELDVIESDGNIVHCTAVPVADRFGEYEAEYWSRQDGGYMCNVKVTTEDGQQLGEVTTGWTAAPTAAEFKRVIPDYEMLEDLAARSGGRLLRPDELMDFAANTPSMKVPITEKRLEPLWHRPWWIALAIIGLCSEWFLRRMKGLP